MSYWTKRRKVDEQVKKHMQDIARFDPASAHSNQNISDERNHNHSLDSDMFVLENEGHFSRVSILKDSREQEYRNGSDHERSQEYGNGSGLECSQEYGNGSEHGSSQEYGNGSEHGSSQEYGNVSEHGSSPEYGNGSEHGSSQEYGNGSEHGSSQEYGNGSEHGRSQEYGNDSNSEHSSQEYVDIEVSSSDDDGDFILGDPLFESDDSDLDDICHENEIRIKLTNWAVTHRITHVALRELLKILKPMHPSLPKDPRTMLSTGKVDGVVAISGGWYYHFGIAQGILATMMTSHIELTDENQEISLQINIDGLPLFKSSSTQFWPILGLVQHKSARSEPFIVGLFSGNQKPGNPDEYLHAFVDEMKALQLNGLEYNASIYKVVISAFICDSPARAFIKNIKSHNAYYGCERCTTRGQYEGNKVIMPSVDAPPRTNESFTSMSDEDHHKGPSLLVTELNFNMITGFPLDPMHLLYLGITRRLLNLWLKGPLIVRLGPLERRQISDSLVSCIGSIPKEFARKPRGLEHLDRWKATELRTFLLYLGPVVLKGRISEEMYDNFMLLSTAVSILANPVLCHLSDYARQLIVCFIRDVMELYGRDQVVYNVHSAQHISDDVELHGPLDQFSAFPFESYMSNIKEMVRKPNFALQQVIRRLSEKSKTHTHVSSGDNKRVPNGSVEPVLKMTHTDGPLPSRDYRPCTQYRDAVYTEYVISSKCGDNCVMVGTDIVIVRNIFQYRTGIYIIYNRFLSSEAHFSYPLDSTYISTFRVSRLGTENMIADINNVKKKFILLPYRNGHVAFPLLHT